MRESGDQRPSLSAQPHSLTHALRRGIHRLATAAPRLGLVARFSLVGASVAIVVAGTLASLIEARLTGLVQQEAVARAIDQVRLGILDRVTEADFEPPFTPEKLDDLASRLDPYLSYIIRDGSGVLRLHLFARDGTVIYSDLAAKRGHVTHPNDSPFLAGALAGVTGAKLSMLTSSENSDLKARFDRAQEVYVPFVLNGRVVGAYEIYQDLTPVQPIPRMVWTAVLGGFTILFLSLFAVMRGAAAHIRRQQAERELLLRRSEERFRALVSNTSDVIAILDAAGVLRYQSPPAERVWGHPPAALEGRSVLELVHPEDLAAARTLLEQLVASPGRDVSTELRIRHADGSWRDFEVIANNLLADPHVAGLVATCHDITDRKAFERELKHLAFRDSLTDLPNRALFLDRLERALARAERYRRSVAVMFLDLDNFKVVNDSLGHETGDRLLTIVGQRLRSCLRAEDTAARFGGDEFTVLLEDVPDHAAAVEVAHRIAAAVGEPIVLDGHEVFPSFSIGIAMSTPGQDQPDGLLRNANLAMYRAKVNGKARCEVFDPSMNVSALERLELEADLRHAIQNGEFELVYQPIMSLDTGRVREMEALLRWNHPERGMVAPAQFIPIAEETGLIVPIGRWVLEQACQQARAWHLDHPTDPPLVVSVNLSVRQFMQPDLVEDVARVLWQTRLDPRALKLEITESVVMQEGEATVEKLLDLKALGLQLAIDDFGTGYSSLSYLKRFPIDTLKIDRSFVNGLGQDINDTAIVQSVIALAKSLNLAITGEGIETPEQLHHLQALGCDQGQGYLFARPLATDAAGALLKHAGGASASAA